jgi:hypothetical protein
MSTTSEKAVALQYSGAGKGKPLPMVLEMIVGMVDRGACISDFSQYPAELEYLWVPCSFVAPDGPPRLEVTPRGVVRLVPVRVNTNLSSRTVEELLGQKRRIHLAAFRFLIGEVRRDLGSIADLDSTKARHVQDPFNFIPVEKLVGMIVGQCEERLRAHEEMEAQEYAEDGVFRGLVTEMLDVKQWAVSKMRWWLEDSSQGIYHMQNKPLCDCHRGLTAHLVRTMPAEDGEARQAAALELCKLRSLARGGVEADVGLLVAVVGDGISAADLRLLIAARAVINDRPGMPSAALVTAVYVGNAEVVEVLLKAKADLATACGVCSPSHGTPA